MTWIFLHDLGQAPSAWQPVLRRLEPELTVHCPSLSELAAGDPRYPALLSALETALDSIPGPLHLCGLSLGGVLAMDYALRHPERVASLVLCGTPLTMPRNLLRLQDFLFRLMPERAFAGSGFSREAMRQLAGSMAELDQSVPGCRNWAVRCWRSAAARTVPTARPPGNWQNNCPRPGCTGSPEPDMKPTWIRRK